MARHELVIVRGAGDLATGVIQKLFRAGLSVLALETARPLAIRRTVALCEAVYDGEVTVEDMTCRLIANASEIDACFARDIIPLLVDPEGASIAELRPGAVVDAILAKKNLGTDCSMAPVTIALGPGFTAGRDVHAVIETMRGHALGRLILEGEALPNTGVPGEIGGKSAQRVIHAPAAGEIRHCCAIGEVVEEGGVLLTVGGVECRAPFTGLVRGLIREALPVREGLKIADIDPRTDVDWKTISDKARCIGGGVLEAYFYLMNRM